MIRLKVCVVLGTRPEAIKLAPVVQQLKRVPEIEQRILVTGQHREILEQMLTLFAIRPDRNLMVMQENQELGQLTSRLLTELDADFAEHRPDWVVVQGDTTTAFIGALAAFYRQIKVAHVEAGLRTQDRYNPFPEEINRRFADQLAHLHFAPTELARQNLLREGVMPGGIHVTGNTAIDALLQIASHDGHARPVPADWRGLRLLLVTAHRRESFGQELLNICDALSKLVERNAGVRVLYPLHPNPNVTVPVRKHLSGVPRIELTTALGYAEFVHLIKECYLVLTDSGGIQEEAPSLGKPVLVMRACTERTEGIEAGTARLVGTDVNRIIAETERLLNDAACYDHMAKARNPYGDGHAAERIVRILCASAGIAGPAQEHDEASRPRRKRETMAHVEDGTARLPSAETYRTVSIFVLVDALGWDYIRSRPFLEDIAAYRGELSTILGFSSGAIPAILTGLPPAQNGHWNLFYYDPEGSPFRWAKPLRMLPSPLLNNALSRKILNYVGHRLTRIKGYFYLYGVPVELLPYFNYCERRDIYQPGGMIQGQSIFDILDERQVKFRSYSYHQCKDQEIIERAARDLEQKDCLFYFLYLSEMDMFLHRHCHEPEKVDAQVKIYDSWLRELYRTAQTARGDVRMYVFSDHGMVPTTSNYDLWREIDGLGFKVPKDFLPFYDSTMARFWFFNVKAREAIVAHLNTRDCGHILTDRERHTFGLDFPDTRYGEVVFLMKPGCLIVPSFLGKRSIAGMHGFDPSAPFSSGALVATTKLPFAVSTISDMHKLMVAAIQ